MLGVVHALRRDTSAPPDERLAGLSLALRALLTLQRLGVSRVLVVVNDADRALGTALASDERILVPVEPLVLDDEALSTALVRVIDEPFFVLGHELVADPSIHRDLVKAGGAVAVRDGVRLPALFAQPQLLETAGNLDALLERAAPLQIGERFAVQVKSDDDRRRAEDGLFEACRKPVDGIVSRHLNRHVSLFVSRRLVNTPITPNQMTFATFGVGVVAAWFASRGGYRDTVIAAALMQLNSILDGCDGELARVRFQGSKLGEWLDTIGDDASNVLYWAGLALGARALHDHGQALAAAGWVAAGANALAALVNYRTLLGRGSGDLYDVLPQPTGKLSAAIGLLLKQDFFLFLLLCAAVAGYVHYLLPAIALGALISLGAALTQAAQRANSR
jgi:phosphatidylglycerophosphate synthase